MLISELSSTQILYKAYKTLNKSNPESYGLSMMTMAEFKHFAEANIENISNQLKEGNYNFSPTRACVIPKDNGKVRPLQIPEIKDRVVLKGIAILLEEKLKHRLVGGNGVSFAYQKGLGIREAFNKIRDLYARGYKTVLEADIIDFFPSVDRERLLKQLFLSLNDDSINGLIFEGISQKVDGLQHLNPIHHSLFQKSGGIPQGNPLSPLFSNLYLSPFDAFMTASGFQLVRYADDFICMCRSEEEAFEAYARAFEFLNKELALDIHTLSSDKDAKTRIVNPSKEIFSFLSITFDGLEIFPSRKSFERFLDNIEKICNAPRGCDNILHGLTKVKNSLDGWISSYLFADVSRYFNQIDSQIDVDLFRLFRRKGWIFSRKSTGKIDSTIKAKLKSTTLSGDCLSRDQRKTSGVPYAEDIYLERMKREEKPKGKLLTEVFK